MNLPEIIKNLGFTNKEVLAYLALLELGEASVQQIAKKSGLKRTTLYPILDQLAAQNYISFVIKDNKHLYFAYPPQKLFNEFKLKYENLKQSLPQLDAIYNLKKDKPKISFYEGREAYKKIYDDTLDLPKNSQIYEFTSLKNVWRFIPKSYEEEYIKRRMAKKIRNKIIAVDSPETQAWLEHAPQELREILLIPTPNNQITAAIEIYGNKIGIISLTRNFMGVVIESRELSQLFKIAFNLMWIGAKQIAVKQFEFN